MTQRVVALIDGFNFYHPINHHQKSGGHCLQWLDYPGLLRYYLQRSQTLKEATLEKVYFFSALAKHREAKYPGTVQRHQTYINALKEHDVEVILGNFKQKPQSFPYRCNQSSKPGSACTVTKMAHEEKETDVRMACKLLELAVQDDFDTCMLLSADSDLVPAIETLKVLYPAKQVLLVTPPSKAKIDKLKRLSTGGHISVGVNDLLAHQFPNEIVTKAGYKLVNPWK